MVIAGLSSATMNRHLPENANLLVDNPMKKKSFRSTSPLITFWITVGASAIFFLLAAYFLGRLGVETPLAPNNSNQTDVWSVNVAIWTLAITSVVSIAGSITAIAIANSANQSQENAARLQEIDVYHNNPAYRKASAISDAYLSTRATLQLILTGLAESRSYATAHTKANPAPMVHRWRVFASDLHGSLVQSDLYGYLMRGGSSPEMTAWAVGTLLTTAEELSTDLDLLAQPASSSDEMEGGKAAILRRVFERNALAYIAAGRLFELMRTAPSVEQLYSYFGGQDSPPYSRGVAADLAVASEASSVAIRSLSSECVSRFTTSAGIPVVTTTDAAKTVARKLRTFFGKSSEKSTEYSGSESMNERQWSAMVLVDFPLPFAEAAVARGINDSLKDFREKGEGAPLNPGVGANKVVHVYTIEDLIDLAGPPGAHVLDELAGSSLMPDIGSPIDARVRSSLDALARQLEISSPNTLFAIHLLNELRQAEFFYLASKLSKSVIIWHGWPLVPNRNVAFKTLLQDSRFSRADMGSEGFHISSPIIFLGTLPFSFDPGELKQGD